MDFFGTSAVFSVQLPGALSLSPGCLWPHGPSCCLVSSSYSLSNFKVQVKMIGINLGLAINISTPPKQKPKPNKQTNKQNHQSCEVMVPLSTIGSLQTRYSLRSSSSLWEPSRKCIGPPNLTWPPPVMKIGQSVTDKNTLLPHPGLYTPVLDFLKKITQLGMG